MTKDQKTKLNDGTIDEAVMRALTDLSFCRQMDETDDEFRARILATLESSKECSDD